MLPAATAKPGQAKLQANHPASSHKTHVSTSEVSKQINTNQKFLWDTRRVCGDSDSRLHKILILWSQIEDSTVQTINGRASAEVPIFSTSH